MGTHRGLGWKLPRSREFAPRLFYWQYPRRRARLTLPLHCPGCRPLPARGAPVSLPRHSLEMLEAPRVPREREERRLAPRAGRAAPQLP